MSKQKNTLRLYGVGGAGINILNNINLPSDATGFPESHFTIIDTSKSNLAIKNVKNLNAFLIPGIDGGGKDRRFTFEMGKDSINKILREHAPKDFNIVIFGLSGATGSVLGPLLIEELLNRGETVVGMGIISTASAKETLNAYNTIGTLQNISLKKVKKPVVVSFYENNNDTSRSNVDASLETHIRALAMLVSGMNMELDKQDISNWLNYQLVSNIPYQLTDLLVYLFDKDINLSANITGISVANLLRTKDDKELMIGQQYSCVGYCASSTLDATTHEIPSMHFIVNNQLMEDRVKRLKTIIDDYKTAEEKLQNNQIIEFSSDNDSGFLF